MSTGARPTSAGSPATRYVVYGPLQNGATCVMYEGAPNFPDADRFWKIIDDHKVTIFYTAPTAIRAFMQVGRQHCREARPDQPAAAGHGRRADQSRSVDVVSREDRRRRCPIVDTWWQTETGAIMISPLPGAIPTKPGSATLPFPGHRAEVVTREGRAVPAGPGRIAGDPQALAVDAAHDLRRPGAYESILVAIPGLLLHRRRRAAGRGWLFLAHGPRGRCDQRGGHRLGTMEVESALVAHPKVAEAAVVGRPDELKGQAISAFVTLEAGNKPSKS